VLRPFEIGRPFLLISSALLTAVWKRIMPSLKQAYTRVGLAFVVLILGILLIAGGLLVGLSAAIVFIVFALVFLSGTAIWARAKGRPESLGVMLGLLGPLGLLLLLFLNDESQRRD
jgi:hypothetical protein